MANVRIKAKRANEDQHLDNEPRELNPNDWELDMDDLPEKRVAEPYDAEAKNEEFDATYEGKDKGKPFYKSALFWIITLLAVAAFTALYFYNEHANQLENVPATTATTAVVEVSSTDAAKQEMTVEAQDFVVPAGASLVKGPRGWGLYDYNDRLQSNYIGIASNDNGTWFVNHGLVDFGFTGLVKVGNTTYHVEKGRVNITAPVSTEEDDTTTVQTSAANAANAGTATQQEAAQDAKEYLSTVSSSKKWLIAQLQTDGYSYDDAVWGAEHCGADWNEQAYLKAKEYLALTSFTREDMITQLLFEGFTNEQAESGATRAGL